MKNNIYVFVIVFFVFSCVFVQLILTRSTKQIIKNRNDIIYRTEQDIKKLKESIKIQADEPIIMQNNIDIVEINQLDNLVIKLQIQNAIDLSTLSKFLTIDIIMTLFVIVSMQIKQFENKFMSLSVKPQ